MKPTTLPAEVIADLLWAGGLRWAERKLKPRVTAFIVECLAGEAEPEDDVLSPEDLERVAAGVARLGSRLKRVKR